MRGSIGPIEYTPVAIQGQGHRAAETELRIYESRSPDRFCAGHEQIGAPALADGILDRLVHNAHRIEMRGDSMRKSRAKS